MELIQQQFDAAKEAVVLKSKGAKEALKIPDWWLPPPADSINIQVQEIIPTKIHLEKKMTRTLLAMMFTLVTVLRDWLQLKH